MDPHVKSINTDKRSNKRIKFASAKQRAKRASADVYRSYKRKLGATSAATREEFVHNIQGTSQAKKRHRTRHAPLEDSNRSAIVKLAYTDDDAGDEPEIELDVSSTFAEELDVAIDRNASEVFGKFHRAVWKLVRSLPEVLHNSQKIVEILLSYMLSPASLPERPCQMSDWQNQSLRKEFVINHATTDILHLLSVLARDLRHEIHPFLHEQILPRIIYDLLNPPPPPPDSGKQPIPLDVTIVEAGFRTIGYILRYDSEVMKDDLESMRKYYGATIANRREIIRRLATETFAPLIRKIKSKSSRQKHLKRVLKALASAERQPLTHQLKRTQSDAVDGISMLAFQVTKGVPGRLHSKGFQTLKYVFNLGTSDGTNGRLVLSVLSTLLERLCHQMNQETISMITQELIGLVKRSITLYLSDNENGERYSFTPVLNSVKLLEQTASFRSGNSLKGQQKEVRSDLFDSLESLCRAQLFRSLDADVKCEFVRRFCPPLKVLQSHPETASWLRKFLSELLKHDSSDSRENASLVCSMADILSKDLMSEVVEQSVFSAVAQALLQAAAAVSAHHPDSALLITFSVASRGMAANENEDADSISGGSTCVEAQLFAKGGDWCTVASSEKQKLVSNSLVELQGEKLSRELVARLVMALRCIPFVTLISLENEESDVQKKHFKRASNWLLETLDCLEKTSVNEGLERVVTIAKSIALESLTHLALGFWQISPAVEKAVLRAKPIAERLLSEQSGSMWAIRGVAVYARALSKTDKCLKNDLDKTFDALVPNLRSQSHSLRLHTLEILNTFPEKHFVTDHSDLDLTGDLDEDPGFQHAAASAKSGPSGPCDILKTMCRLEKIPIILANERAISALISRIEVLGRSGKLPVVYAEAVSNYMIGSFYVKFAPVWPEATRCLTSLLKGHEKNCWPALEAKLRTSMERSPQRDDNDQDDHISRSLFSFDGHLYNCEEWQSSNGTNVSIFGNSDSIEDLGTARHQITDEDTATENIWGVAAESQHLVGKNSRVIIPVFLAFLHNQYFGFHINDPDARELELKEHVPSDDFMTYSKIDKGIVYRRLLCFLKVFAVLDGPKQLVHHQLLERIFRCFLNHQDETVARLALTALSKYKVPYLVPYQSFFFDVLKKGQLKDSLLDFAEKYKEGKVVKSHRAQLMPLLVRLLFGRLSPKGKKSSKDTPASRRTAVLSFLSVLCEGEEDVFNFVFMMTRSFIPRNEKLVAMEQITPEDRENIMGVLMSIRPQDLVTLPSGVIEGFLHLLETVLTQLGHRISSYVPQFASIVLALCKMAGDGRQKGEENGKEEEAMSSMASHTPHINRYSSIRSLGCKRLSEIYGRFGDMIEVQKFGPLTWEALNRSVYLLPEMTVKTEKAPAILELLEVMSSDCRTIEMLAMHEAAVESVVKCIAETSMFSVMNSALSIVENLLTVDEPSSGAKESTGIRLIRKFVPLLMECFTARLERGGGQLAESKPERGKYKSKGGNRQNTWKRELEILCRVSELLSNDDGCLKDRSSILATLFSLLLPYLEPDRMTTDDDKMNIIGILKSTVLQLDQESMAEIYSSISKILSPSKGKAGIRSLTVRHAIAELVGAIAVMDEQYREVADSLLKLTAVNSKRVDEMDFDVVIPELNKLSQPDAHKAWLSSCGGNDPSPPILNPLIAMCFHFLHNEDGVVLRVSHSALKMLIDLAARMAKRNDEVLWTKLVESSIMPFTRAGLQSRDASVRRYYILLVKGIAASFKDFSSANLCGDLHVLVNDENPDLDFFMNITHVQIHRRARGFQRLRSSLNDPSISERLSLQSVSNILLPITLHPLYECNTRADETFALEAIATVGSISRLLSWSKYNNMLWAMLTHFDRYPEQERYLIGAICATIDSFHFDLTTEKKDEDTDMAIDGDDQEQKTAVWRSLERRMIPKIEGLLMKEKVDRSGTRTKTIRPPITLALLKLFQKFPASFFEAKLPHLLSVICDALRNKDSDARDIARKNMAKIVVSMDLKYLADVIREISITLNEGYKLHVRAAVLHTILQELSALYKPPLEGETSPLYFDQSIGGQMELIQEDLFGEANERRESKETNVRYVKEAGGSKSIDSVELICRLLKFRPSDVATNGRNGSSIHCVVSPLLERLRQPDVDIYTIRKIRQLLTRVVVGLSHNPSVDAEQLFPFVYATVEPFVGQQTIAAAQKSEESDDEDMDDAMKPIKVSGSRELKEQKKEKKAGKVELWRPSTLKMVGSAKDAQEQKLEEKRTLRKVKDGASAPKLTGSGRHQLSNTASHNGLNDPASITAVIFGLNLLNSCLKKLNLDHESMPSRMDPFVPLLTACVCFSRESDVALVGLKCLMSLLRFDLPSISSCSENLGTQALEFLNSSGSSLNQNSDLTQACFRTLTYLIKSGSTTESGESGKRDILLEGEEALAKNGRMPLNSDQMKVLISTLQLSVTDSDQHNPALGLIKAILARRYISSELYDLMEVMLKLVVRSHTSALRQQSSTIFLRYLLDYPMGEQRFEKHLTQIVANTKYEYQDGRLSAIQLMTAVVEKLPDELLSKHTQSIFIPLVLQMVNDESDKCHDGLVKCLEILFTRSSREILQVIHVYMDRWAEQPGALRSASVEVLGILVDARSDFIQQKNLLPKLVESLHSYLEESNSDWQVSNSSILCVEKLSKKFDVEVSKAHKVWKCIVESLVNDHPSVRLSSCRVLHQFFAANLLDSFLTENPGMLFEIGRNICFQMNSSEKDIKDEASELCIKTLSMALPIMKEKPDLCFAKEEERNGRDPVYWLLQRLSQIAKPKGSKHRMAVFKCFAAFCTLHSAIVAPYLELILEPLHRSSIETRNQLENPHAVSRNQTPQSEALDVESNYATEVMQVVEETAVSSEVLLAAMSVVKKKARDKKDERKLAVKLEAANDPKAAAERKIRKQSREKNRVKRRVAERKQDRGSFKKRRSRD
ncbi:unnamed protein product [Cylindrotheca closterium]|uniref:Uncharacterized protein n=1 Tax=Cylindrotheca closterium TaxID=2856 RepID=A0AAD2FCA0_9STRA|nr:unnamed protein product [Cylindrotheca closterium]